MRDAYRSHAPRRRGLTLMELLLVVSIMILLTGLAIPALGPAMRGREIREAARSLTAYLTQAQTRAIETGRPVGVAIERSPVDANAGVRAYMTETPPPFSGLTVSSRVEIIYNDGSRQTTGGAGYYLNYFYEEGERVPSPAGLLRPGDLIRFNNRPELFQIQYPGAVPGDGVLDDRGFFVSTNRSLRWRIVPLTEQQPRTLPVNLPLVSGNNVLPRARLPYQILRQPLRTAAEPLQFGPGTVIDLSASGFAGADWSFFSEERMMAAKLRTQSQFTDMVSADNIDASDVSSQAEVNTDVVITFQPDGSLGAVYRGGVLSAPRGSPLYLLLGELAKTGGEGGNGDLVYAQPNRDLEDPLYNIQDVDSRWVKIEPGSGSMIVSETLVDVLTPGPWTNVNALTVATCRQLAREGRGVGGR